MPSDSLREAPGKHTPVLLQESIDGLALKPGETFVDGTFGGGGHSSEVRRRFGDKVRVIGLDRDPAVAKAMAGEPAGFDVRTANFTDIDKLGVSPDAILLDLGFSSDQLESVPGLSFLRDEPLDMRLSGQGFTATDVVNSWDESAIELILKGFGEERYAKRIARAIAEYRTLVKPFETTAELVAVIESAVPAAQLHARIHPATRTFQAIRIAVNEELPNLEKALERGFAALAPGGRFAVISFHSLEDRIVKNFFRDRAKDGEAELLTKKPIVPAESEISANPRSRSAKLRIAKKL
jgi:16S rRNA (cytosine1402-N4)-methyltransferase